jgi:MFS transporter, SHS family, lactate transporter
MPRSPLRTEVRSLPERSHAGSKCETRFAFAAGVQPERALTGWSDEHRHRWIPNRAGEAWQTDPLLQPVAQLGASCRAQLMKETNIASAEWKERARTAVGAAFLGWTIDAFDFFVLVFAASAIAEDFHTSVPKIALTMTASLVMRPFGALGFGLLADRYGRRRLLVANVLFYTLTEVASGFASDYSVFFALRLLYGIGMGGNWGVGASLAMESAPVKWRGIVSGLLQEGYAIAYFTVFPHWGWRAMFFIGALPALITVVLCLKIEEPQAWRQSHTTSWAVYWKSAVQSSRLFLYLVLLMTMMTFISHGTQDMYPTFLQRQRRFGVNLTAFISAISMVGAILGGLVGGHISDRLGRRRMMVIAVALAAASIPLWVLASSKTLVIVGAFLMQFMVQAAWGVVPAHINELSPGQLRGIFPGLAYQLGVLFSSGTAYLEAVVGEHFSYAASMGGLAAVFLLVGAVVIWAGPEARGESFIKLQKQ